MTPQEIAKAARTLIELRRTDRETGLAAATAGSERHQALVNFDPSRALLELPVGAWRKTLEAARPGQLRDALRLGVAVERLGPGVSHVFVQADQVLAICEGTQDDAADAADTGPNPAA